MVPEFTKQLRWVAKLHFMIKFIIIFQIKKEKKGMSCILMLHIIVTLSWSWCYYNLYFFGEHVHALDFSCHGYLKFKWIPCFTTYWQIQVRLIYWFHRKYKLIDPRRYSNLPWKDLCRKYLMIKITTRRSQACCENRSSSVKFLWEDLYHTLRTCLS